MVLNSLDQMVYKLSDEQENEIEALLDQENPELPRPVRQ